ADKNQLYIAEDKSFTAYSLDDFSIKYSIGKDRELPPPFKYGPEISLHPGNIFGNGFDRFKKYSPDGKLLLEKSYSEFENFDSSTELKFLPVGDKYIRRTVDHNNALQTVWLVDRDFREIKKIYDGKYDFNKLPEDKANYKMVTHYMGIECYKDRIYIGDSSKGSVIDVYDSNGSLLHSINTGSEELKITEDYKTKVTEYFKKTQAGMYGFITRDGKLTFYDQFPAYRHFQISDDKIYVTTYREDNNRTEIIILDLSGKILERIFVPLKTIKYYRFTGESELSTISGGRLYELIRNPESRTWELHISKID
ncbi:MAG: hypothetical protein GY863_18230, partial [bacterium]|nr:hypothetical protein [bacterium]